MGRKYDGLMRNKNNPNINQQQFTQCHTKLVALRKKCNIMLEKEVSRARFFAESNKRNKACEQRIKTLYYLIGLIDNAVDRLYEIHNINELNSTFNELESAFKQLNKLSSSEKTTVKSMPKINTTKRYTDTVARSNAKDTNLKAELQLETSQPLRSTSQEVHIDVDEELEQINMYLEGFFED